MNKIKCPSCNSENTNLVYKTKDYFLTQDDFDIYNCKDCKITFTSPFPNNLSKYYETTEYLSHDTENNGILGKVYNYLRNINIRNKYNIVTKYINKGSILDIGSGTGELLNYFKNNNWQTQGVEPSEKARQYAISKHNLNIVDEPELTRLTKSSYDVISMWHVLEHVPDINKRIVNISQLLKKNGVIIIAVPNINSPDSQYYKEHWAALDVPRHLYHFSKESMKILLEQHKFQIIDHYPMKMDAYYVSMLSEKYLKRKTIWINAILRGFISNLKARKNNNYSSMIFVVKRQ